MYGLLIAKINRFVVQTLKVHSLSRAFLLLAIALPVGAEGLLDIKGLTELAAAKAGEIRASSLINLRYELAGALYLPVYILHSKPDQEGKSRDYFEIGVGGELREGGDARPIVCFGANLPSLSDRILNTSWLKDHLRTTKLPSIWVGPFVRIPIPGKTWIGKAEIGGMVSIGLGGK